MLCYTNFPAHSFVSPRGALFPTSMWGLKSQLTHVFPRQCTSQQVHSPFHLQEEALPGSGERRSGASSGIHDNREVAPLQSFHHKQPNVGVHTTLRRTGNKQESGVQSTLLFQVQVIRPIQRNHTSISTTHTHSLIPQLLHQTLPLSPLPHLNPPPHVVPLTRVAPLEHQRRAPQQHEAVERSFKLNELNILG
ncbi:uncharacterized protein LOC114162858 [Vigna unguiculata]|uniref:uncharacterized protein LOC114162858 n=1 Tax=Vigna unguiculata TaxID=3917 RepID=UPI00101680AA|nr:uncharacterized protein LOC114162858 [Vigna unguiculata]